MKKHITLILLVLGFVTHLSAQQHAFGIGAVVGSPTGISARFNASSGDFVDALLAWDVDQNTFFQGHYNFRLSTLEQGPNHETVLYGGPGLYVRSNVFEQSNFGFSGNFGVGWTFKRNLEVFAEVSPKIGLVRQTDFLMTGGLGFRYLF